MEKITLFMLSLFAILLVSCSENDEMLNVENCVKADKTFLVPEGVAIEQAISFFNAQEELQSSKQRRARVKRRALASSNSNSVQGQEGVYIINFDNNAGFAVVSADNRDGVSVYLASSDGNFDENSEMYQDLLATVKDYQKTSISSYSFNPDKGDVVCTETTTVEESYGPLLNTCWSQGALFNKELENIYGDETMVIGCVPVAIGQILNYFQYPDTIRGEYIDWNLISLASGRESGSTPATDAASRFLYLIGLDLGIDYRNNKGASYDKAVSEFIKLGYSVNTRRGFSAAIVKNQVSLGRPVYMRGQNSKEGHAWVADGFMKIKKEYRTYDEDGNLVENTVLNDYNYDNIYDYVHLNLGWGYSSLPNVITSFEYQCGMDHKIWAYSDIFNFSSMGKDVGYNEDIKIIYNFSHD